MRDPHLERILHAALGFARKWQRMNPRALACAPAPSAARQPAARAPRAVLRRAARRPRRRRCPTVAGWSPAAAGGWSSARAPPASVPYFALQMQDAAHLQAYRSELAKAETFASPLLAEGAFAVTDPDGRRVVFGLAEESETAERPARRGCSISSARRERLPRDARVLPRPGHGRIRPRAGRRGAGRGVPALRSRAPQLRRVPRARSRAPDHHCYETNGWLDIRDWADRMASLRIPLWWGPGRHGPGNNLFFMIEDPDGHKVEFSAELELMPQEMPHRTWPHEQRTLNLWGSAWMRVLIRLSASSSTVALSTEVQANEARVAELRAVVDAPRRSSGIARRRLADAGAVDPGEVGRLDVRHRQADLLSPPGRGCRAGSRAAPRASRRRRSSAASVAASRTPRASRPHARLTSLENALAQARHPR